jgi:hypothetical protein
LAEHAADTRQQQGLMFALLAPLAALAIAVWLVEGQWLRVFTTVFALYSVALNWLLPASGRRGGKTAVSWVLGISACVIVGLVAWYSDFLFVLLLVLTVAVLSRLWYLRQYHLQQGRQDLVELLRRCLLISLWSHISVLVAWINPY